MQSDNDFVESFDRKFEITDEEPLPDLESFDMKDPYVSIPNVDNSANFCLATVNPVVAQHYPSVHARDPRDLKSQSLTGGAYSMSSSIYLIDIHYKWSARVATPISMNSIPVSALYGPWRCVTQTKGARYRPLRRFT